MALYLDDSATLDAPGVGGVDARGSTKPSKACSAARIRDTTAMEDNCDKRERRSRARVLVAAPAVATLPPRLARRRGRRALRDVANLEPRRPRVPVRDGRWVHPPPRGNDVQQRVGPTPA